MKKPTSRDAREAQREDMMANAGTEVQRLLEQADIRGIDPTMCCTILAMIIAARNATLAGKCLMALEMSIQKYPIRKIIGAGTLTVDDSNAGAAGAHWTPAVDLVEQPDGSFGEREVVRPVRPECSTCACSIRCADDPHGDTNPAEAHGPAN